MQGGQADEKADKHATAQPRIHKRARRCPLTQVGSHTSFLTFTTNGIPKQCMKLTWPQHKIWVSNSIKQSAMPLNTSETFLQNILQESSDKIRRSCLKDHQKSVAPQAPAIQPEFRASGDRFLDQNQRQNRLILTRSFVDIIVQTPNKDELTKEFLQHQERGTQGKRTYCRAVE